MTNLTLTVDEDVLRRARIKAIQQNTSVNAVVREFLESYARDDEQKTAVRELLKLAEQSCASSGPEGRTWKREDLYEDRLGRFGS